MQKSLLLCFPVPVPLYLHTALAGIKENPWNSKHLCKYFYIHEDLYSISVPEQNTVRKYSEPPPRLYSEHGREKINKYPNIEKIFRNSSENIQNNLAWFNFPAISVIISISELAFFH